MRFIKISIILTFAVAFLLLSRTGLTSAAAGISIPRSVTATDGDHIDKVTVMWNAVPGATRYRIYRSVTADVGSTAEIGVTAAGYFFDFGASANQQYFYRVRAENDLTSSGLSPADSGLRASGTFHSTIFSPLSAPPSPAANPVTASKAMLGKALFWDEQLSSTRTVACGTCHRPASGGSDPRTVSGSDRARNPGPDQIFGTGDDIFGSPGVIRNNPDGSYSPSSTFGLAEQVTGRKAPSYLNVGTTSNGTFWDGRATNTFRDPLTNAILINSDWGALESQSAGPPMNEIEMAHVGRNWSGAASRISESRPLALATRIPRGLRDWIDGRTYPELFAEAFGTPDVTPARIALAIATHERTLFSDRTPLDRWSSQIETLTPEENRGRDVFITVNCSFCHGGPLLADQNFHNVGVRPQTDDLGRGGVTGNLNDNGRFKTPTLRNIELRGPYFHNGRISTLEEVVEFYNRGGDFNAPNINRGLVRPLNLTAQQKSDLVAFLRRPLTDPRVRDEAAPFDRPRLYSETDRVPVEIGTGRAGTGGILPKAIAIEPPIAGNPSFAVGLSGALANSTAVLVIDSSDPGVGASIPTSGSFARVQLVTDGQGFSSKTLPIPANLAGRTFFGRFYVTDAAAQNGFSATAAFRFTVFVPDSNAARPVQNDFDGDGRSDIGIFRPSNGQWWVLRSSDDTNFAAAFGNQDDRTVAADFSGDGRSDIAVWRPGTGEWLILRSEDSTYYSFPFGTAGDIPKPADFDGDGIADAAVFRPSGGTWFVNFSSGGTLIRQFGIEGDQPVASDYDGDGRDDIAIFRPSVGQWWIERSSGGTIAFTFGTQTDAPLPADLTGDGKSDVAFWRPVTGEWFVLRSEDASYYSFAFGSNGDLPLTSDFDGDGKADPTVFRPSTGVWYSNRSSSGLMIRQFGTNGDRVF